MLFATLLIVAIAGALIEVHARNGFGLLVAIASALGAGVTWGADKKGLMTREQRTALAKKAAAARWSAAKAKKREK